MWARRAVTVNGRCPARALVAPRRRRHTSDVASARARVPAEVEAAEWKGYARAEGRVIRVSGGAWLRRAPLGVLAIGFALLLLGSGFVLGGLYLALTRGGEGWMPWLAAIAIGPLLLYFSIHVLRLSRWAWLVLVGLGALLLASALIRFLQAGPHPFAPLTEIAIEAAVLGYLTRPRIRRAFGRE
jgi:hypothetical protein